MKSAYLIINGKKAGRADIRDAVADLRNEGYDLKVISEVCEPFSNGEYVILVQGTWLEASSDVPSPVNLDGEPIRSEKMRFDVLPEKIRLVAPANSPCIL